MIIDLSPRNENDAMKNESFRQKSVLIIINIKKICVIN